jgi:phage-related protein
MAETPTMEVRARLTAETAQFTKGIQQATQSMNTFTRQSEAMRSAMVGIGVAAGVVGAGIIALGIKSFNAAARVDELDIAMNAVGKSTGLGYAAIREATLAIKANGIEMDIAQKSALKFAQNQIDLTKAADLARVSQDLAVISGMNSSDTYNMLTHAVITGRSEVLKSVGIQKSAGQMYEDFARSIGKTTTQLTHTERQTAVLTGALSEGAKVAGTYEAAMTAPGKVLRSFARVQNEIMVSMGNVLLKGFGPLIFSAYNLVKAMAKASEESKTVQNVLEAIRMVVTKLTAPIALAIDKITEFVNGLDKVTGSADEARAKTTTLIDPVTSLAEKFEMMLPVLAAVTAGFATFAGNKLLTNLPILGKLLGFLSPLPVALVVLALTSTQVRNALTNLLSAFKPLLPIVAQFGKIVSVASVIGVAVLAKAINGLAAVVRGSINFIKTYAGVFKVLLGVLGLLVIMYGAYRAQVFILNAFTAISTALTTAQATATGFLTLAQAKLNLVMAMNPVGVYIALLVGLITVFGYLMATNERFASVVGKVFNFVMKVTIKVLAHVVKAIGNVLLSLSSYMKVLGFVAEVVAKVFEFIMDVVLTYYQFQLVVIQSIINAFINLMESQGLLYDVVKTIFNGIIKIISLVVEGIIRVLAFIIGTIADLVGAFNDLFGGTKKAFLSILDVISNVAGGIFNVLENIASNISRFLGFVYDKLTGWIRAIAALFEKIPKIGDEIANNIRSGLDAGRALVTGFAGTLVGFGKKAFDGIVTGVENAVSKIGGIGAGVEKGLRATEKVLTNFAVKVEQFGGKDNGAKILEVMVSGAKMASSAIDTMIDAIQDVKDFDFARTVGSFIDGIASKTEQAGTFLIGLSASMMEFADNTDFAASVGEGIGNFINKIKDSLKEGLGFGDILKEEEKKYNEASKIGDDGAKAAEDALKSADRMNAIREAMQAGIDSIKGVLDDLRKASGEFADSLKDTIMGFAGLKSIELPDGFIPKAKSLIENMRQRLDKSNQFAQQIATLQAMGLDSGALKDIIESGPVKGAQLAASILGGGAEAISQINALQKAISFSGAAIGQFGADAAFGGLIGNAQAQLNRLTEAELATRTSGNNQFIQQGAFQVVVNTSGAANTEEEIKMITDKIEQTFAILAKELAAK